MRGVSGNETERIEVKGPIEELILSSYGDSCLQAGDAPFNG